MDKSKEIDDYIYSEEFDLATLKNITNKIDEVNDMLSPFKLR